MNKEETIRILKEAINAIEHTTNFHMTENKKMYFPDFGLRIDFGAEKQ